MDGTEHVIGLGKIVGNLHSLELLLRVFLCEAHGESIEFPSLSTGAVQETHLTNFMSLGDLIDAYNSMLTSQEKMFSVARSTVKVRDAIAHGRLTSLSATFPLTLHKFGRPRGGRATVELVEVLSVKWLDENRQLILDQMEKIQECANARRYKFL